MEETRQVKIVSTAEKKRGTRCYECEKPVVIFGYNPYFVKAFPDDVSAWGSRRYWCKACYDGWMQYYVDIHGLVE